MGSEFSYQRRVAFSETDMAGIVHFAEIFRYMEEAEHAFYRSLGFSVHPKKEGRFDESVGWPRVKASAEYRRPLEFEEVVTVELRVSQVGSKSLDHRFLLRKETGEVAAKGALKVVCVRRQPDGPMKAVSIPDEIRSQIMVAEAASLEEWEALT
ncbi:MAG: acyl-CoA thioesterase [Verrucomicrobiota bacterium]